MKAATAHHEELEPAQIVRTYRRDPNKKVEPYVPHITVTRPLDVVDLLGRRNPESHVYFEPSSEKRS